MPPRFSMISASLKAKSDELQAEYAIAAASDEERMRAIQAKIDHLAELHRQIVGRPIEAPNA